MFLRFVFRYIVTLFTSSLLFLGSYLLGVWLTNHQAGADIKIGLWFLVLALSLWGLWNILKLVIRTFSVMFGFELEYNNRDQKLYKGQ